MDITLIYHYLWFGDMGQKLLPNLNTQVNKLQIIARIISRKIDRSLFIIQNQTSIPIFYENSSDTEKLSVL